MTDSNARVFSAFCLFTAGADGKDWDTTIAIYLLLNVNTPIGSFFGAGNVQPGRDVILPNCELFEDLQSLQPRTFTEVYNGLLYVGIQPHHGAEHDTFDFDLTLRIYFTDATAWEVDIPNQTLVNHSARTWRVKDGTQYSLTKADTAALDQRVKDDEQSYITALAASLPRATAGPMTSLVGD